MCVRVVLIKLFISPTRNSTGLEICLYSIELGMQFGMLMLEFKTAVSFAINLTSLCNWANYIRIIRFNVVFEILLSHAS